MKKCKILSLLLAAAMIGSAAIGCTEDTKDSTSSNPNQVVNNEDLHAKEIPVNIAEEAVENQTSFKLNKVLEYKNNNNRFIYLDVSITNSTDKAYELNCLNNFYILFDDGTESHFDIRTQITANPIENYAENPFEIPANGTFSGVVGGFIIPDSSQNFTVCFFPTRDDNSNKSSVIKVKVDGSAIVKMS